MRPRTVGLIVAAALALGWLMGDATTQEPSAGQPTRSARGARPLGSDASYVTPYTDKLRERMKEQPATPERGRNPFVYSARGARSSGSGRRYDPPVEAEALTPPPAVVERAPMFRLSGIASNLEDGKAVLTAIVIDNGAMVFAKAGDKLSNGYSVVRIDETSVTLVDADGVTQTLRLR